MRKIALLCFMLLLFPVLSHAASIETLDQAGLTSMLEQNRGKVILINFFATWCPPCRAEIPEIVALRDSFPTDQLLIIGLSVDENKAPVPSFVEKLKVNYPVYMAARDITDAYNVTSVPHNAFIGTDGRMVISEPGMAELSVLKQVVADLLKGN